MTSVAEARAAMEQYKARLGQQPLPESWWAEDEMLRFRHDLAMVEHCRTFGEEIAAGQEFINRELLESGRAHGLYDMRYRPDLTRDELEALGPNDQTIWQVDHKDEDEPGNNFTQPCMNLRRAVRYALDYANATEEVDFLKETISDAEVEENIPGARLSEEQLQSARLGIEVLQANEPTALAAAYLRLIGTNCGRWGYQRVVLLAD